MFCNDFFLGVVSQFELGVPRGVPLAEPAPKRKSTGLCILFGIKRDPTDLVSPTLALVRLVGGSNPSYLSSSVLSLAVAAAVALTVAQP